MKIKEFINEYEKVVPLDIQDEWDNSGFQLGNKENILKGITLSLDFSINVVEYAVKNSCNLIFTHHPVFFNPIKSLDLNTNFGKALEMAIKNNISIYSSHTNLDYIDGGVSDALANLFELNNIKPIVPKDFNEKIGLGRFGTIPSINGQEFLNLLKSKIVEDNLLVYGDFNRKINSIGFIGGSGASEIPEALKLKLDLLITSDIKYHNAEFAIDNGLLLIDLGHYISEKFILEKLYYDFQEKFNIKVTRFYYDKSMRKIL
ncbi:Nif3-like dinuclear metal center hexameric protein [Miniphocaeibacter halophilus]|uniref:Nif3-like dinuclear metal center hexameric protein n=1 Tax=Miniphocaeibacter halophilus TaxID=2931922 RepID=A0AC61MPX4_9FIRM|nr:Nif3-like dinuclear metal center hexameric protein [Miniphocaeibacter halophilus]QQK07569.1 Nif3-like dinuclear metal center hexameric protein [Miniphocaeibacter halophilus]